MMAACGVSWLVALGTQMVLVEECGCPLLEVCQTASCPCPTWARPATQQVSEPDMRCVLLCELPPRGQPESDRGLVAADWNPSRPMPATKRITCGLDGCVWLLSEG